MPDGPAGQPAEDTPRRTARRVRVRVRTDDTFAKRVRKFYTRHRRWLVPAALFALGTVGIWLALKFFIPLEE